MARTYAIILLLLLSITCYGQHNRSTATVADPYAGRPYKAGDVRTLHLPIPVGKTIISCRLKYTLLDDPDGMFYAFGQRYKAEINSATVTASNMSLPQELVNGFTDRTIELTDKEIRGKTIQTTSMYYWFEVQDFNLDGKPDFAFIGDLGYHSVPVNHYIWVNIKNRLVYWYSLSCVVSYVTDSAKRMICVNSQEDDRIAMRNYKIEKDTALIALTRKESE